MKKKTRKCYRLIACVLVMLMLLQGSNLDALAEEYLEQDGSVATSTDANEASESGSETESESDSEDEFLLSYRGDEEPDITPLSELPKSYSRGISAETTTDIPTSYNSSYSTLENITKVKNQGKYGVCWAFATCAGAEANIYRKYNKETDLSEWQLAYFTSNDTVEDPLKGTTGDSFNVTGNYLTTGGNQYFSVKSLASWRGLTDEDNAKYETVLGNSGATLDPDYAYGKDTYHLKNAYMVDMTDTDSLATIKANIMKYGACGTSYYDDSSMSEVKYYKSDETDENNKIYSVYCYIDAGETEWEKGTNHAVTIVGWDDNYSASNFKETPAGDGAWYVKNSWGGDSRDSGYFWISYYDASLGNGYFYDMVSVSDDYDNNYQYDGGMTTSYLKSKNQTDIYEANVYTVQSDEELKAIGFYTEDTGYTCSVSVYVGVDAGEYTSENCPLKDYEVSATDTKLAGYHTVDLSKAISLKKGTRFSIVVKQTGNSEGTKINIDSKESGSWYTNVSSAEAGQSFLGTNPDKLHDISDTSNDTDPILPSSFGFNNNCRIKAFTDKVNSADGDDDDDDKDKDKPVVTTIPITGVSISESTKSVVQGKSFTLTATVAPSNTTESKQITWTSSDSSIATVTGGGTNGATATVNAVGSGTVTITAKTSNGKTVSCKVTVQLPTVTVSYRTHVQKYGWEKNYKTNGAVSGTSGESKRLEAIQIKVSGNDKLGIQYVTHCQSYGWLSWSSNDEVNGTSGESKRLEAIEIQLTGEDKDKYDVYYRVHAQSYGWLGWAKNGAPAGTAGLSKRLEAIQILVVRKGESINTSYGGIRSARVLAYISNGASKTSIAGADSVHVAYKTHVQSYGWQKWVYDGSSSGTTGKSKRLEGINIKLTNKDYDGSICYITHVQSYGWQGNQYDSSTWKKDGEMAGTSGKSKRLEAIRIKLTGEIAEHYDVYYRVHAQTFGWMGWAKNGEAAGTAGYSKRLEAIQIVLVPKGGKAPGSTANSFRQKK